MNRHLITRCNLPNCVSQRLGDTWAILISCVVSSLVVSLFLIRLLHNEGAAASVLDMSIKTMIAVGVWAVSVFISSTPNYESVWDCIIGSAGVPGLVSAIVAFGSEIKV